MVSTLFTVSLAWFSSQNNADIGTGQGYTASAYFAGGDGSAANPYVIDRPIHLYNLAWLQYLGLFNKNDGTAFKQQYFVLGSDVDMASTASVNWMLPPIGTSKYPFIGNFDGKGYTISNLVVDNAIGDGHITRKPSTVGSSISDVNIVGTFGVVGDYGTTLSGYTYSSSANSVANFTIKDSDIRSSASQTLIGIAAGYVNSTMSNVSIKSSKATVASGSNALSNGPTTNISDYTTIGYCAPSFRKNYNQSVTTIKAPSLTTSEFAYEGSGDEEGWGGSIDMKTMYNRLLNFHQNPTHIADQSQMILTETINVSPDGTSTSEKTYYSTSSNDSYREYYDGNNPLKGSYCFGRQFSGTDEMTQFLYLNGYRTYPKTTTTNTVTSGGSIFSGANYLAPNGATGVRNTTTASEGAVWYFSASSLSSASSSSIYTTIDGTTYYLSETNNALTLSTTSFTWSISYSSTSGYNFYYSSSRSYYNINYSGTNGWYLYQTSAYIYVSVTEPVSTSSSVTGANDPLYDTYFPLNVYGTNDQGHDPDYPKLSNTGYVISSAAATSGTSYGYGNIRVSQYPMSSLSNALNGSTFTNAALEVVTRTASSGGFVRILDDNNANNWSSTTSNTLTTKFTTKTAYGPTGLNLQKYKASRQTLGDVLSGNTSIYGLHFMNVAFDITSKVSAAAARIKGVDYTNYQMPRNCIDFNLQKKGYINFFAGTYYSNNSTFFALQHLTRGSDPSVLSASKTISQVFTSSNEEDPPIYKYSDNTYSATMTSSYSTTAAFDMSWVTSPTMVTNAMYYFEIPAAPGEYALSAVSGKTGAYLIYLDISANAQQYNRTTVTENITNVTNVYLYPLGVSVVSGNETSFSPLNGVAVALLGSYSGSMTLAKADSTITLTSSSDAFNVGFKGDSIALARSGSTDPPVLVPSSSTTSVIKRVTYYDYNTFTKESSVTIITDTDGTKTCTDENGTPKTTYVDEATGKTTTFGTGSGITINTLTSGAILTYSYFYSAEAGTITVNYKLTHTQDTSVTSRHVEKVTGYTITLASTTDDLTVTVTIKDGAYVISFTANGTTTTVEVGSTLTVAHG